jgi:hypothetical protein
MCDPSACGLCFNGRHCDSYSSNLHNKQSYYHRHANWKNSKENLTFLIDEASKKISFADGVPLSIQRFDDRWISVTGGGVSYELDRESRSLSFAGTIMKEGTATIIIGAGRCSVGSDAR